MAIKAEKNKCKIIVFAHNSRGYDGHFIMQDIFDRDFKDTPQIILQGLKVLKIGVNNVQFIDSLSFFQQPLSSLPKSFNFEKEALKGFFPHKFNLEKNWHYIGKIPDKEMFDPDFMSESNAKYFEKWHAECVKQQNGPGGSLINPWEFSIELKKYCSNDVKILTIAVMEFRALFKSVTDLDPITRNFTLASVAMEHFRSKVLEENQIGITPVKGYINLRNKSKEANIWIDWLENNRSLSFQREIKIGPYYVNAIDQNTNTIYEFFSCFFHGCAQENCNKNKDRDAKIPVLKHRSLNTVFNETNEKVFNHSLINTYKMNIFLHFRLSISKKEAILW